jgi:hypothetical protein
MLMSDLPTAPLDTMSETGTAATIGPLTAAGTVFAILSRVRTVMVSPDIRTVLIPEND